MPVVLSGKTRVLPKMINLILKKMSTFVFINHSLEKPVLFFFFLFAYRELKQRTKLDVITYTRDMRRQVR